MDVFIYIFFFIFFESGFAAVWGGRDPGPTHPPPVLFSFNKEPNHGATQSEARHLNSHVLDLISLSFLDSCVKVVGR